MLTVVEASDMINSPLDIPAVDRELVTTDDIVRAVRDSREQAWRK